MNSKSICLTISLFCLLCSLAPAQALQLCGKAKQGEILVGHADKGESIVFNKQKLRMSPSGEFLIAFGRDDQKTQYLTLTDSQNASYRIKLEVSPAAWDIQNLKGIPPRKVTPSNSDLRAIEKEQSLVRKAQKNDSELANWQAGFTQPVKGRISGNFGGQRIMNGVKKNPHAGMDIAAPEGTPVKAASDGVVTLAEPDLFYSGNVIILDHGYGLHTIYAHLSKMDVQPGDIVKKGQVIGLVGKTGRVTGPHLHWGASLNGVKFNPQSLLNINKNNDFCFTL